MYDKQIIIGLGKSMSKHWSQYWDQGHLTSFGDSFLGNYTGELKQVWQAVFDTLPDDFSVLDIATGNGALPLMIQKSLQSKMIKGQVVGVDLANVIQPKKIDNDSHVDIKLLSEINCCALPFENDAFDLATSQFGIEYAPLGEAIPEALRVLKKGGILQAVVHHRNSMIINRNLRILQLIGDANIAELFSILKILIQQMGEVKSNIDVARIKQDKDCESLRLTLNGLINGLISLDEDALKDSDILTYVAMLFKTGMFWPLAKKLEYLTFAQQEVTTLTSRLTELVGASVSEVDIANMLNVIANGASLETISVVRDSDDSILAWQLKFLKV